MFRHILVPLDSSGFSRAALPYALSLATGPGTVIELLSAVDVAAALSGAGYAGSLAAGAPAYGTGSEIPAGATGIIEASRRGREESLRGTAAELQATTPAEVRWAVVDGEPSAAIESQVQEGAADIVVMSTHGRGGLERAWLGSVADRLIRRLGVPLLLVRPTEDEEKGSQSLDSAPPLRRILVPLDGSPLSEAALLPATRMARALDAALVLVRVSGPEVMVGSPYASAAAEDAGESEGDRNGGSDAEPTRAARAYLSAVAERLRGDGVEVGGMEVREGAPAATILHLAREQADVVAMATHGRGGVRRWLLGSVSDKVVRGADVPVLLVRPDDAGERG